MTRSATSTEQPIRQADSGFRPWHFYILLAMAGATVAVMLARNTHPAALLLLSAAVVSAGLVGLALHHALGGFMGVATADDQPLTESRREALEKEKVLTLRAIKDLEFDRDMGKVSAPDFLDMEARLRRRALVIIEELERQPAATPERAAAKPGVCGACGTRNEADARFCKSCGARLAGHGAA